jgi:hypothetical protein
VEIVVGSVPARVSLCAERGAKDDEVLGYRRVDDVHRAHSAASVVEDPFFGLADCMLGMLLPQSVDDLVDDCSRVVGIVGEGAQGQLVELGGIKDVPSLLVECKEEQKERRREVSRHTFIESSTAQASEKMPRTSAATNQQVRFTRRRGTARGSLVLGR